jgi:hypothetical protein
MPGAGEAVLAEAVPAGVAVLPGAGEAVLPGAGAATVVGAGGSMAGATTLAGVDDTEGWPAAGGSVAASLAGCDQAGPAAVKTRPSTIEAIPAHACRLSIGEYLQDTRNLAARGGPDQHTRGRNPSIMAASGN